jgi:hypothetical protein
MDMNSNLGPASAQASVTIVNTSITIQSPIIINKCKAPSLCPVPITPIFVFVLHPTASITANPTTITEGQATTITWTSTNASSCTAANALGNGTLASSGSLFESPSAPGTYTYTISCSGSGGTSNPESTSVTVTAPITIQSPIIINKCKAPSLCLQPITPISVPINSFVPANLTVTGETVSTISLSWATSTEAGNTIVDYLVYRNGNLVGIAFATSFTDTGLTASTSYGYTVAAYDASGNVSSRSASVTGKTSGAPSVSSLTSMIAAIQSATTSPQNMISTAERLGFTVATGTIAGGTPYVTIEQPPANTIVGAFIGPQY